MKCIAEQPREVPGFGIFEPGQVVDFDPVLFSTGIFERVTETPADAEELTEGADT